MDHPRVDDSSAPEAVLDPGRGHAGPHFGLDGSDFADLSSIQPEHGDLASSLEELASRLEGDDEELTLAVEGLASVEPEIRTRIIDGLGKLPRGPGLTAFLRTLGDSLDPATRSAAQEALNFRSGAPAPSAEQLPALRPVEARDLSRPRLVRSVVSAVDGRGRATIALSASRDGTRRSAVFDCDVLTGVYRTSGVEEAESAEAGGLIDEAFAEMPLDRDRVEGADELALALLAGTLHLSPGGVPTPTARSWVDELLGPGFRARPIPVPIEPYGRDPRADRPGGAEMPRRARAVLEACPSWIDTSMLTFELAEEIELREGVGRPTDPVRHAGAYRYLFEHGLIRQLDLYGRMLLWMAWYWRFAGEPGLSDSAVAVAAELADEQYAVPSHPFTVALTTRSLDAARLRIRTRGR